MTPDPSLLPVWVAEDPASQSLLELVHKVAPSASTVLILGESGSGKDQLARLLHYLSPRRHEPVVKIDCTSLPAELIESELFGYEKGAFTGAYQAKPGRLEMAGGGTLVLDEIAALTLPLQAKLLRVIEEKSFERLGGHTPIHIRARLLALTNVDLEQAVAQRAFREDLYYRLFVLPLAIPPLRERPGDIIPLANYFLASAGGAHPPRLSSDAREALQRYRFPGNVRELRNLLNRAVFYTASGELTAADFPPEIAAGGHAETAPKSLAELEREHIAVTLRYFQGRKQDAARSLGISPKTLIEKRRRYGLDPPWTERLPDELKPVRKYRAPRPPAAPAKPPR